jgi:AcrR family transcriptional regulator
MGNMKEKIKSVATELFFRKGYFAMSVSDIARGCGIQRASIYYHSASKEELLFTIINSTIDDLMTFPRHRLAGIEGGGKRACGPRSAAM